MKMFITSNQQFGRQSAITKFGRKFNNIDEMNDHMIKQWNDTVSKDDLVYVAGNFAWDPDSVEYAVKRLNGNIIVMPGEHDTATEEFFKKFGNQDSVPLTFENIHIKKLNALNTVVSYWPLKDWPNKGKNSVSIIGHPSNEYKTSHIDRVINVTCDMWDYKPVNIKDLLQLFQDPDVINKK